MKLEKQLIQKEYYKNFFIDQKNDNFVQILGQLFMDTKNSENSDLTDIRFSQGEVYYFNKDFEAAIFKWEKVSNDLKQWARKNIGDAYFELNDFSKAIQFYKSISSECLTLNSEVALRLFLTYNELEELDLAAEMIKRAVSLNPDYSNVTELALNFFEEYRDWGSAIELAVNEAIRTGRIEWFEVLKGYVDIGLTKPTTPNYFSELLEALYPVSQQFFEEFVVSFWNSYKDSEQFFSWIRVINRIMLNLELDSPKKWLKLVIKYEETYIELINGQYYVKEISDVVPDLLTNWLNIADAKQSLFVATAVIAWNEIFAETLSGTAIEAAEQILTDAIKEPFSIEDSFELYKEINVWARTHEIDIDKRLKCCVEKVLDLQTNYLLVAVETENGKSSFFNSLLDENTVNASTSSVVMYSHDDHMQLSEVSEYSVRSLDFTELNQSKEMINQGSLIDVKVPNRFLLENQLTVMDVNDFNESTSDLMKNNVLIHLADGLLYILTAKTLLTDKERNLLLKINEQVPQLPIHFLYITDGIQHKRDEIKLIDETRTKIAAYFPKAKVFPYSTLGNSYIQIRDFSEFVQSVCYHNMRADRRNQKFLFFIRETISYLLRRRIKTESDLSESIVRKEDFVSKLNVAVHQLYDLEKEKIEIIENSFRTIKEDIKHDLNVMIPKILKECSSLVKEDSNFQNIHNELNNEMNEKVYHFFQEIIIPKFSDSMNTWLEMVAEQFQHSQEHIEYMSDGFNMLYGEKRLKLECDFNIINDWRRDVRRLANRNQYETINILNHSTPKQIVINSAGKLFNNLLPNKKMLCNLYKKQIEKDDYELVVKTITNQFTLQLDLFEKGLERDISMFFSEPFNIIQEFMDEEERDIQQKQETLQWLGVNPEWYLDPLTLFQLRLRQYELLQKEDQMAPLFL